MKKNKILKLLLVLATILAVFCVSAKVFATEPEDNVKQEDLARSGTAPGENARGEGEPVVTSEDGNSVTTGEDNQNSTGNDVNNQANPEIYNGDLYVFENKSYTMDKMVDGNVFIFGKDVTITGQVNGAVYVCASGTLTIDENAYIGSDLFAFAQTIELNGLIFDVYAAADKLNINQSVAIYRDIRAFANEMTLAGSIGRDAYLSSNKMSIAEGEDTLTVYGDLNYESKNQIANIDKATIQGEIKYSEYVDNDDNTNVVLDLITSAISTIIFNILIYIVLIFFAPKFVEKTKEYVSTKGLIAFAIGIAFTIAVPVIALVLLMLNVGAASAAMLLIVYAAILMVNAFVVAIAANEFIAEKLKMGDSKFKKGLLLIATSFVLWGVRKIPFIGGWISVIVFMCGIGIVIFYQFDKLFNKEKEVAKTE